MSVERKNGHVTPSSISVKPDLNTLFPDAERDAVLLALHEEIVRLFTEKELFSHEIAEQLGEQAKLDVSVGIATRSSFIRKVIAKLVDQTTVQEIHSKQRADMLNKHRSVTDSARDESMRKMGMFVWSSEETEILRRMMTKEDFLLPVDRMTKKRGTRVRARHCNFDKMLDVFQFVFPERGFTKEYIVRKADYLRTMQKKKDAEKTATISDQQTSQVPQAG